MATQAVDILIKARDQASATFGGVGRAANAMSGILKNAAMAVGGYLSARAILSFAQSSIQAFSEEQQAVNQLGAALDLLGKKTELSGLLTFAAEIQRVSTVSDDAAMNLMKFGASIGGLSGDTLKQATIAAIGLSKAYGIDLQAAMLLVSKAAAGNTASMGRYGIVFKEGMTDAEKFNQVLEIGRQKFAMAEAETQTFAGRIAQLSNAWGDAKEQLGQYIATSPMLSGAINFASVAIQNLGLAFDIVTTSVGLSLVQIWESFKFTFTDRIPAAFDWFKQNWFNLLTDMAAAAKQVVTSLAINFGNFFKSVWDWANGKGFNFEWTGLLDGFTATTEKFPDILSRQATDLETAMSQELQGLKNQFNEKLTGKDKTLDQSQLGAAQLSAASAVAAKDNKVSAVESRFLSGQNTAQDYNREIAGNGKRQTGLLERIARALEKQGTATNTKYGGFLPANLY